MTSKRKGQTHLRLIGFFTVLGLLTSVLAFLQPETYRTIDPVLVFLLFTYPFLIGTAIYYYLQSESIAPILQEEYYAKWQLQSFAKICLSETDLQVIREELASSLLRLIKPALISVYELNSVTNHLEIAHQAGIQNLPKTATQGYAFGEGIPGWVMQNQNVVAIADIATEQHFQVDPWAKAMNLLSYAAVPIIVNGESIGIIAMYSLEQNHFQDSDLLVAQLVTQIYGLRLAALQVTASEVS